MQIQQLNVRKTLLLTTTRQAPDQCPWPQAKFQLELYLLDVYKVWDRLCQLSLGTLRHRDGNSDKLSRTTVFHGYKQVKS